MNMEFKRKLPAPEDVINMYPLTEPMKAQKAQNDAAIRAIFTGESDKLLLVIGPCSADREDAVLDYISRLRPVQEKVKDKIVIVPRIYTNKPRTTGQTFPNYHYEDLQELCGMYAESGLKNPAVIIDTNHSNSGKRWMEQPRIVKDILYSTRHSEDILHLVKGLMIESYIEDGCQKVEDNVYGKSITDPCLGWEKTERLIMEIAEQR